MADLTSSDDDRREPIVCLEMRGAKGQSLTPDMLMKRGLFSASRVPARQREIKSFQTLHRPKLHGMAEWLLQYESAHRRQEKYLQQIHDLRQQFRIPSDASSITSVTSSRGSNSQPSGSHWRHSSSQRLTSSQLCVLHPRPRNHNLKTINGKNQYYRHGDVLVPTQTNNFMMAPRAFNKKNARLGGSERDLGSLQTIHVKLPPIATLDRHTTDYEPIDTIAERNKLNLRQYLGSGQTSKQPRRESLKSIEEVVITSTKIL